MFVKELVGAFRKRFGLRNVDRLGGTQLGHEVSECHSTDRCSSAGDCGDGEKRPPGKLQKLNSAVHL
jgi:hypothetical protein